MKRCLALTTASSGILLPVLMVLSIAQEATPFSHIATRQIAWTPLQQSSGLQPATRRRLSLYTGGASQIQKQQSQRQITRWATLEHSSIPSMMDEDDDEDDDLEEDLDEEDLLDLDNAAANGQSDGSHKAGPPLWNHNGTRKRRKRNKAMSDPVFLRKRTEALLSEDHMENSAISSRGMKADRKTFHFLIDAWAFSGEDDATEQAYALIHKMEDLAVIDASLIPDVRSYTKVINAIARSNSPHAGNMADEVFDKMNYLWQSGINPTVKPNTFTYTAVVEAHANSGILGSAQHAAEICDVMARKYLEENDPDVRPTARAFNAVINAFARIGDYASARQANELFLRMESLYLSTGLEEVKPNTYNYNSLISAWANCGDALEAEGVLARMEALYRAGDAEVKPTTVTYNSVIDCYSKRASLQDPFYSPDENGERAEGILRHMEKLYVTGENIDAKPNVRSYNTVINVWAKSKSSNGAKRAEEILDLMEKMYAAGDHSVRPDVHSFSTVINAWARSQQQNKAERALNILKEMKQLYQAGDQKLRPNVVVANAVMNACAYTMGEVSERNRAMEIAHKVLKSMESGEYGRPDQITYGTFLKVCTNQMPECSTREQIVEMIFRKCVRDGQVGNLVLQELKAITTPEKYFELVGLDIYEDHGMEALPNEWWCNVVEGKWRRRRNF